MELPHPRDAVRLYGHEAEEAAFMAAFHAKKLHHAWIFAGMEGSGKATLSYRLITQILSGKSLKPTDKIPDDAISHQIKAQSHPNLIVLEKPSEVTATGLGKDITIESVRKINSFFGSTAGEDKFRICLIDTMDDLNANSANALLKMVEEPPKNALFIMISQKIGGVLPTLRSRSRLLKLEPLSAENMRWAATEQGIALSENAITKANGSLKKAYFYGEPDVQELLNLTQEALKGKLAAVSTLADRLATKELHYLDCVIEEIENALVQQGKMGVNTYEKWAKITSELTRTKALNLDRKAFIFSVFQWLDLSLKQS